MTVEQGDDGSLRVRHGSTLVAEATSPPGLLAAEVPDPVSLAEARTSQGRARYFQDPVFPECFVCGIDRRPGDGLRIFPGPVPGRAVWVTVPRPAPALAVAGSS
jgi:hypothetical protein